MASSKTGAASAAKSKSAKTSTATKTFNDQIALLLGLAASAPLMTFKERKSAAKLFELAVLAELLNTYTAVTNGSVKLQNAPGNVAAFAGAPASADKSRYSYFTLHDPNDVNVVVAEGWVSVQFTGLSAKVATDKLGAGPHIYFKPSRHELDLMLVKPGSGLYPQYSDLWAAVSLKHVSTLGKESVREALGFRREMGLLTAPQPGPCSTWLEQMVPANPPVPLYLVSSAPNFEDYESHIDQLAVYARYMKFPF